jgi:hypothetical protein
LLKSSMENLILSFICSLLNERSTFSKCLLIYDECEHKRGKFIKTRNVRNLENLNVKSVIAPTL